MNKFMFDANCFHEISFKNLDILNELNNEYYVTYIQLKELENHKKYLEDRKERLLKIFKLLNKEEIPIESMVFGNIVFGKTNIGNNELFNQFKRELDEIKLEINNIEDALMAESSIKNEIIFVTSEKKLIEVIQKYFPNFVMSFNDFKKKFLN